MINVPMQMSLSLSFHVHWVLIGLVCVLPSMMFELIKRLYCPSITDVARFEARTKGCVDFRNAGIDEVVIVEKNIVSKGGKSGQRQDVKLQRSTDGGSPSVVQTVASDDFVLVQSGKSLSKKNLVEK